MSSFGPLHHQEVRDAVGDQGLYAEAAEPSQGLVTYSVISYSAHDLPQAYRGMVFAKWLRSLRFGNDYFKLVDSACYYSAYHRYISNILGKLETVVTVAVLSDDKDVALGFSVSRGNILDYVHVHKDQRKQGIGTRLIPRGIDTITHLTRTGLSIWGSKYKAWKFDPFT